jgi:hypothetical protein
MPKILEYAIKVVIAANVIVILRYVYQLYKILKSDECKN